MYIAPNSEIYLLQNIPIQGNYEHTLWFNDLGEQEAYFTRATKVIAHLTDYSYLRYKDNWITVELPIEKLTFCNYMAFRNLSFENKLFYAFVTNIEYVNNKTTKIYYDIDVIQTWLFEARVGTCFVEREHSATDAIGANLVPENFETGEYVYQEISSVNSPNPFGEWYIFIGSTVEYDGTEYVDVQGNIYQGLYSGVKWLPFKTAAEANAFIEGLTDDQKSNAIVGIVMLPSFCAHTVDGKLVAYDDVLPMSSGNYAVQYYPSNYPTIRNNKLKTAPYTQLLVTDFQGHSAEYDYEYFDRNADGTINFLTFASVSAVPQFACQPTGYKGVGGEGASDGLFQSLIIGDIPQCAFTIDSFRAWIAMASTKVGVATDLISGAVGLVGGVVGVMDSIIGDDNFRSSLGQTVSSAKSIADTVANVYDHYKQPPQAKSIGGGSIVFQRGAYGFQFLRCYIRPEFVRIIDDYFTMYGYRTNQVKIPNIFTLNKRPKFNYIKTIGARITGSVPVDDERKICSIFDRGITFWDDPAKVGDYSQDNSPV